MLLCMKFIGFVFELFQILGNEFLYICFLNLIFVKSYLAGRESFIDFFKPVPTELSYSEVCISRRIRTF